MSTEPRRSTEGQPAKPPPAPKSSTKRRVLGWLGVGLHCTVVAIFYYAALLIAPMYAVYSLWVLWVALLALAIYLAPRRPAAAFGVPFLAIVLWYAVISIGAAALNWTA